MPLTDRDGSDDDGATDLGEIVVSGFRHLVTELPFYAYGPEPSTWTPSYPDEPPPEPTPREQAVNDLRQALLDAKEAGRQIELTQEQRDLMQQHNIGLHDLLMPGIYQFEFTTAQAGEHRQWVRVTSTGTEIISGNRNMDTLDVFMNQSYEANTAHGRDSNTGTHRIFALPETYDTVANLDARWAAMEAAAAAIINQGLNYNFLEQNSNSVFNTVGNAGGIDGVNVGWHWAPGADVDLTTRNETNQPGPLSVDDFHIWIGGSESDSRTGESDSPNMIEGGAGNDSITGGTAFDSLFGGDGNDVISALGGSIEGGAGNDTIGSSGGSIFVSGDAGDDTVTGGALRDVVDGGDGDDYVLGGDGDDRIWGAAGADDLYGNDGYDVIAAGDGDDVVYGGGGNDMISGNTGLDILYGGDGDDALYGGRDAGAPDGQADTLDGGDGADVIYGSTAADTIYGGAGNDLIFGGMGADNLWGGAGADVFKLSWSGDSVSPEINPYLGIDVIHDFEHGVDKIDLSKVDIALWSPTRIDTIHWWSSGGSTFVGWDMMSGGIDSITIELVGVTSFGWEDLIFSDEDIVMSGWNFNDDLHALDGDDTITGLGGADTITGGRGADVMSGGTGNDAFIYYHVGESTLTGSDIITDLQSGDVVNLSGVDANTGVAGDQAFSFVGAFTGVAGQAVRAYDSGTNVTSLSMDVNGDGVADMLIRMNGDQTAFTGFSL